MAKANKSDKDKAAKGEEEYIEWLVRQRSRNQESCLQLFLLLKQHQEELKDIKMNRYVEELVSIAFSLWRAVFLGNKLGKAHRVIEHSIEFLEKLVLDNAVLYATDKTYNEWSFNYYVNNARYRLIAVLEVNKDVPPFVLAKRGVRARWEYAQDKLDELIADLRKHLQKKSHPLARGDK